MNGELEFNVLLLSCPGTMVYLPDLFDPRIHALNNYGLRLDVILPVDHLNKGQRLEDTSEKQKSLLEYKNLCCETF